MNLTMFNNLVSYVLDSLVAFLSAEPIIWIIGLFFIAFIIDIFIRLLKF